MHRRTLIAATGAAVVGAGLVRLPSASAATGWQLRWAPDAATAGLGAFEGVEDDRADSHPAGQPHIFVQGTNYRFNMHLVDRDTQTDRQRQEVKGMRAAGADLIVAQGSTWRWTYSMFIPASLKATTTFTHLMQMKMPGTDSLPILTTSLQRVGGVPKIQLHVFAGDVIVGRTDLAPLQSKWIDVEFEMTVGDGSSGAVRWVLRDGAATVIDVSRSGLDTFLGDRVRPKWGIYRSLGDTSGSLQDTYLLLTNLRAYQAVATAPPVAYEAENATITHGVVESNHAGYFGTGFVNLDNVTGSAVQFAVSAASAGSTTLTVRYANGTSTDRPMDVAVNGTVVRAGLPFPGTGAWDSWKLQTLPVALNAGGNTIRLTAVTANGGPNLDRILIG